MKRQVFLFVLVLFVAVMLSAGGRRETASDSTGPVSFTIFIDHSWYPIETFTGVIPDEITRISGVRLEPTIAIDDRQLGVMIGSGELPDLVYTSALVDQLSDSDVSYSFEELIARYNTGWNISPTMLGIARGKSQDGKAYTLLNHYSDTADWNGSNSVPMLPSLLYRTDMYQAIGSPPMRNFDELFDVFTRIKQAYPNLGAVLKLNQDWNVAIFNALAGLGHAGEYNFPEQSNGGYLWYGQDPRYKEAIAFLNRCWRAGFISPDESYFVRGSVAVPNGDWFASSSCTQNSLPSSLADHRNINPNWTVAEMVPFDSSSFITSNIGWSGTFITKRNKNPEQAIRFMQWMFSPEAQALTQMGRNGIDYNLNSQGLPVFSPAWLSALQDGSHDRAYNPWFYLGGSETVEADSRVAPTDPVLVADAYRVMRERYDNRPWVAAARPIGNTDEKVILDKIKELTVTYEPRLIMAASPAEFESLYREYVTNLERTESARLNTYMNNKIREILPMYR
jgi:putative aldouronate transport system substrate-binding protein